MSAPGRPKREYRSAQHEGSPVSALLEALQAWVDAGWLRELDLAFARFLAREVPDADPLLLVAAALASHQLGRGHVALDLAALVRGADEALALPPEEPRVAGEAVSSAVAPHRLFAGIVLGQWQQALADARLVAPGEGNTPLVLQGTRLYLRRFWQHERTVRSGIAQRLAAGEAWDDATTAQVRLALDALFPAREDSLDWQKVACALALRHRFAIVTGGPGTGKTTTVVKLLALLQQLALSGVQGERRRLRIRLAAPTGKAAARLNASIAGAIADLPLAALGDAQALRAAIPTQVSTVHRLLGSQGATRRFRYGPGNPLPLDVLVLDEASMIDLETMAAVLAALPAPGRIVLLGDKDQLASVEAGNVLGELCRHADEGHYRADTCAWIEAVTGQRIPAALVDAQGEALDQAVVKLRRSWRFGADSGIGQLAEAVNRGDVAGVGGLRAQEGEESSRLELDARDAALRRLALDGAAQGFAGSGGSGPVGYRHYLALVARAPGAGAPQQELDDWARAVLAAYGSFQLLCAVRRGPQGVDALNERIAMLLHAERLTTASSGWYAGRPVMVTRNDYALGLMNGDVGITLPVASPEDPASTLLRVAFTDGEGGVRWVSPSRLREIETVFAMTVHKSQGSEFAHAALLLPASTSRVLTRELVYTGVTRARRWFTLALPAGAAGVLEFALARRTREEADALAASGIRTGAPG
jgi:exodeoxyribonuclease V alpha subunit